MCMRLDREMKMNKMMNNNKNARATRGQSAATTSAKKSRYTLSSMDVSKVVAKHSFRQAVRRRGTLSMEALQTDVVDTVPGKKTRRKPSVEFAVEEDGFESTTYQKAICGASFGMTAMLTLRAMLHVQDVADLSQVGVAALGAYVFADLASGIFHWSVDNYGGQETPVVGNIIVAFQGHHKQPWTITMREFCNNTYKICTPTIPFLALLLSLDAHPASDVFWSLFGSLICLSQQFHAWSHQNKNDIPPLAWKLQQMGLLISCKAHSKHHREPFENNYCIVSGLCNPYLDNSGILQHMEQVIYERTGVSPRCWVED